ncbi:hypothetical protein [Sphingomonas bacterium]|uniref:hypothetical protein n=1 Tax=Sphingomonas bacterium TaxID=1895847 RepID=UPI001576BC1D|nr:hypothetical protein [Sphingomonas bacterium]
MLELLRSHGLVLAGPDQTVLRYLQFRRHARALPLHDIRGKTTLARAWQITDAGVAAALRLAEPKRRRRVAAPEHLQIDLEEAIAASSGGEPEAAPLPDPDAPTVTAAGVSAPQRPPCRDTRSRPSRRRRS